MPRIGLPSRGLSHMADCQLFGMRSGWHHLTNVLLHALAALLLFAALKRMTGARWPSAFVAFLFALHPLHVESVAWISERKDVLCALFWFLALWCYARYAERPGVIRYLLVLLRILPRPDGQADDRHAASGAAAARCLAAWPSEPPGRSLGETAFFRARRGRRRVVTYVAQGRAVRSLAAIPSDCGSTNALVTYATYIFGMFWPANLAVFYPYRHELPLWQVAAAAIVLAGITARHCLACARILIW